MHHNCGRVGDSSEGSPLYLNEVEDVLTRYPELKFVWVHAGVSRRCAHPKHHEMIDRMCSTYDNLKVDISWVVWEDVICDDDGIVKKEWVDTICKHHTKFFIGSDNVAQFFPINDTSTNLLAMNITKCARHALSRRTTTEVSAHNSAADGMPFLASHAIASGTGSCLISCHWRQLRTSHTRTLSHSTLLTGTCRAAPRAGGTPVTSRSTTAKASSRQSVSSSSAKVPWMMMGCTDGILHFLW